MADFGAKHLNPEDIQGLSSDIFCSHINNAFKAKSSADGCGRNAMLTCAGFRDDTFLANPSGQ
jgi:hypothetical protein